MGKGSAERPGDRDAYRRNWDAIFKKPAPEPKKDTEKTDGGG